MTFLWRAAGSPEPKDAASGMSDVVSGSYYEKAVAWAIENGITTGTTTSTFSPDATCTRAQSVTFLYRALGTAPTTVNGFTDVAADAFYADAVAWAVESGVTNGTTDSTFSPQQQLHESTDRYVPVSCLSGQVRNKLTINKGPPEWEALC